MGKGGFVGGRARFDAGPASSRRADVLWAIAHAKGLTTSERCVLFVLESFVAVSHRATGECWPAVASIAEGADLSERQTQTLLRSLQAKGWLSVRKRSAQGHQGTNCYRITPPGTALLPLPDDPIEEDPSAVH